MARRVRQLAPLENPSKTRKPWIKDLESEAFQKKYERAVDPFSITRSRPPSTPPLARSRPPSTPTSRSNSKASTGVSSRRSSNEPCGERRKNSSWHPGIEDSVDLDIEITENDRCGGRYMTPSLSPRFPRRPTPGLGLPRSKIPKPVGQFGRLRAPEVWTQSNSSMQPVESGAALRHPTETVRLHTGENMSMEGYVSEDSPTSTRGPEWPDVTSPVSNVSDAAHTKLLDGNTNSEHQDDMSYGFSELRNSRAGIQTSGPVSQRSCPIQGNFTFEPASGPVSQRSWPQVDATFDAHADWTDGEVVEGAPGGCLFEGVSVKQQVTAKRKAGSSSGENFGRVILEAASQAGKQMPTVERSLKNNNSKLLAVNLLLSDAKTQGKPSKDDDVDLLDDFGEDLQEDDRRQASKRLERRRRSAEMNAFMSGSDPSIVDEDEMLRQSQPSSDQSAEDKYWKKIYHLMMSNVRAEEGDARKFDVRKEEKELELHLKPSASVIPSNDMF
eukprot:TRINITY_DN4912_c0_g2_i1.p1 TRINITY_DN4912_c0_g2~~TRINITY_DN4912_c0_g2_i1.p1  ORF type:complete len:499 (+),score=72.64 TRINITY_DN4912_c0_g2_i1:45-1541(+)